MLFLRIITANVHCQLTRGDQGTKFLVNCICPSTFNGPFPGTMLSRTNFWEMLKWRLYAKICKYFLSLWDQSNHGAENKLKVASIATFTCQSHLGKINLTNIYANYTYFYLYPEFCLVGPNYWCLALCRPILKHRVDRDWIHFQFQPTVKVWF